MVGAAMSLPLPRRHAGLSQIATVPRDPQEMLDIHISPASEEDRV